jgi:hypothetical protein
VPTIVPAVNTGEVARPVASVVAVAVATAPANVPFGSAAGAVKVTVTPLAGDVPLMTVAVRGLVKAAPTTALCPPPPVAAMVITGGVVCELLLQLVRKVTVEKTKVEASNAPMLQ